MLADTDNVRIREIRALLTPNQVTAEFARTETATETVADARAALHDILHGADDRLAVVVGPCSIHDPAAAMDYALRLRQLRHELGGELEIVMRVYFAKPRTTVGWEGLINDPDLDGSFRIDNGLRITRKLLLDINNLGLPVGCEFLDIVAPQYVTDLISWGAIGARTTESQIHRELASGLSCPIGFKNGTDGKIRIAVDAVKAAAQPHHFLAVTKEGRSAIAATTGNKDCHIILRGGEWPNYDVAHVTADPRRHDRRQSRQLRLQPRQSAEGDGCGRAPDRERQHSHHRCDDREPSGRRPSGSRSRQAAVLRPEHHRRLHRLGHHRGGAASAGGRGATAARPGEGAARSG